MLSQLCTDINEWQCVKVCSGTEQCMDHLQTTLKEADLHILMHVLDFVRAGYSTCVVIFNDTDVIIALLYYVPVFRKEGLKELWVWAGRDNTTRFVPLHILHSWHGNDLCKVLPALHSLTGCDITSKIGTKKAALQTNPEIHLQGFGMLAEISPVQIQHAERYLNVVKSGSNASNFTDLRRELFHFSKSTSHQNLPPTSQGLEPSICRAFFNGYNTMQVLDEEFGFTSTLEDGHLLPSSSPSSWNTLEAHWTLVCHCSKCAQVTCPFEQPRWSVWCWVIFRSHMGVKTYMFKIMKRFV